MKLRHIEVHCIEHRNHSTSPTLIYIYIFLLLLLLLLLLLPHCTGCKILVSQLGMEHMFSAVEARNPKHWTIREFLVFICKVTGLSSRSLHSSATEILENSKPCWIFSVRFAFFLSWNITIPNLQFPQMQSRANYIYQGSGDSKQDDTHKAHLIPWMESNEQ